MSAPTCAAQLGRYFAYHCKIAATAKISSDRQFTVEDITRAMKARSERQRAKKRAQAKPRTRHTKRKADELTWWRDHVTQLLASDWLVDIEREVVTHVLEWLRLGGLPKGNVKLTIRALLAAKARRDLEVRRRKKGADDDALRV